MHDNLPAHAKYGPSSMARIIACPGSVKLQEQAPPQKESPYAAEGTRAHNVCEAKLLQDEDALSAAFEACEKAGDDLNEVDIHTSVYVKHCDPILDEASKYGIETKLVLDEEVFGTADCYALVGRVLHVIDYKHGAGVIVSPQENKQGLTYAALVFMDDNVDIAEDDVDHVIITIVQPRGQGVPIQHWGTTTERVVAHMHEVDAAINSSKLDKPPVALGDHCKFCTAKLICPAMEAAKRGVCEYDSRDIPADQLEHLLTEAKALEGYIKDLFTYAYNRIEAGESVPGWKLTAGRRTRVWENEAALLRWAKKHGKMTALHEKKLVSPAKAVKLIDDEALTRFIGTKESKPSLKPESAPGEPVETFQSSMAALGKRLNIG